MSFILINGMFAPSFGVPDGDSVRFIPESADPLFRLKQQGRGPKISQSNGSVQLRYEAIDTMEKVAKPPFPLMARDFNLESLGTRHQGPEVPGYILSRSLDKNGRPICFAFKGEAPDTHGSTFYLDETHVTESVNYKLAAGGWAYPMYYDTLFANLRNAFSAAVGTARASKIGVWEEDASAHLTWTGDVSSLPPVFPKLWRRIQEYVGNADYFDVTAPMRNLKAYIEDEKPERVLILSAGHVTGFDNTIETTDTTVALKIDPTEMIFQP